VTSPEAPVPSDPARYRALMSRWATGVSVLTAHDEGGDAGLTVNALLSVSLAPPSLLVSISTDADTLPVIERSGHFGVSFLAADQRAVSERFALTLPAGEKFAGIAVHRGPHGSPLLDGALGALECQVVSRTPAYDHVLIVGDVVHDETGRDAPPLLFFRSAYAEAEGAERLRLPAVRAGPRT
jgi:3-hydroxy-9,10-secoandrosta-1,3,5(10)-triene-9,17-dione monooxygenase reductase component